VEGLPKLDAPPVEFNSAPTLHLATSRSAGLEIRMITVTIMGRIGAAEFVLADAE
jgi:hypothetical protein